MKRSCRSVLLRGLSGKVLPAVHCTLSRLRTPYRTRRCTVSHNPLLSCDGCRPSHGRATLLLSGRPEAYDNCGGAWPVAGGAWLPVCVSSRRKAATLHCLSFPPTPPLSHRCTSDSLTAVPLTLPLCIPPWQALETAGACWTRRAQSLEGGSVVGPCRA